MTRRAFPDPVRGAVLAERVAVDLRYLARLAEHSGAAHVTFTAFCAERLDDLAAAVAEGPPRETALAHAFLLRNHPQTAAQVRDLARGWTEYAERTYTAVEQAAEVQAARTPREVAEAALTERASEHAIGLGERCVRADRERLVIGLDSHGVYYADASPEPTPEEMAADLYPMPTTWAEPTYGDGGAAADANEAAGNEVHEARRIAEVAITTERARKAAR